MGNCCPHSFDFQPETNIKDTLQLKKEDTLQLKKEDTPIYHIRRISKGKHIILPHHSVS